MGAVAWWGLRAYSRASRGMNAVRIRRTSDNAEQDFRTLDSGALDRAAIGTFLSSTTGQFVTWYDQVGTNHATQATAANQPDVNLSGIGSLVTGDFNNHALVTSNITQSQPNTWSFVAKNIASGAQSEPVSESGSNELTGYGTAANQAYLYAGTQTFVSCSDGAWHARQAVYNGAASDNNIDGAATTQNAGSLALANTVRIGGRVGSAFLGSMPEIGLWFSAFTSTQSSNVSANQHAYWGF